MLCGNPILWPLAIRLTAMAARVVSPKSSHGVTQDRAGGQVFRNGIRLRDDQRCVEQHCQVLRRAFPNWDLKARRMPQIR